MSERWRILQFNTQDRGGGAANIAWQLFTSLRERGHHLRYLVGTQSSNDPEVVTMASLDHAWARLWLAADQRLAPATASRRGVARLRSIIRGIAHPGQALEVLRGREKQSFPATWRALAACPWKPDLIHAHNLHGDYFDLRALPWLSQQAPVVITLHDAWLLSGHCAHSFDCERWRTGCGACPDLSSYPALWRDGTAGNWQRKRALYAATRLHLTMPCHWLRQRAEASPLMANVPMRVIPYGLDLSIFCPGEQAAARQRLGLPVTGPILLFAASGIRRNIWKDYQTMRAAVTQLASTWTGPPLLFLALGEAGPSEHLGQAEIRFFPYRSEPQAVADYYRAADVYVHAAKIDTFPNTVLEAQACGIPVVASAVGGIPEQIVQGETGFLVPAGDVAELAHRLGQVLSDLALRQHLGEAAARRAAQLYDKQRHVQDYEAWYQEILATPRHPAAPSSRS